MKKIVCVYVHTYMLGICRHMYVCWHVRLAAGFGECEWWTLLTVYFHFCHNGVYSCRVVSCVWIWGPKSKRHYFVVVVFVVGVLVLIKLVYKYV